MKNLKIIYRNSKNLKTFKNNSPRSDSLKNATKNSNENSEKSSVMSSEIERFFRLSPPAIDRSGRWSTKEGMVGIEQESLRKATFYNPPNLNLGLIKKRSKDYLDETPKRRSNSMDDEWGKEHHHTMPTTNPSKDSKSNVPSQPDKVEEEKIDALCSEESEVIKSSVSSIYEKTTVVPVNSDDIIELRSPENFHIAGDICIRVNHKASMSSSLIWRVNFNTSFLNIGDNFFELWELDPWSLHSQKKYPDEFGINLNIEPACIDCDYQTPLEELCKVWSKEMETEIRLWKKIHLIVQYRDENIVKKSQ